MSQTITNPIIDPGADPWVVRHQGAYYYCHAGPRDSIRVRKASSLTQLGQAPPVSVWQAPSSGPFSRELWAPELHWYRERWYIYVAADDGNNAHHRMIALVSEGSDPQGVFSLVGKLELTPDRWAIDGTLLQHEGKLYFIWSGWEGTENIAQHLYLCPMRDPVTPSGPRVRISSPTYAWEQRGSGGPGKLPTINEGPQVLQRGKTTHIIYSASGSWCDDYCLGRLTLSSGGEPLNPAHWHKHPEPVFEKTDKIFGPGHCSFVDNWIVYHTARHSGAGWDRVVRAQPFAWNGDIPVFGKPQDSVTGEKNPRLWPT